jgi:hypothetical protein
LAIVIADVGATFEYLGRLKLPRAPLAVNDESALLEFKKYGQHAPVLLPLIATVVESD